MSQAKWALGDFFDVCVSPYSLRCEVCRDWGVSRGLKKSAFLPK